MGRNRNDMKGYNMDLCYLQGLVLSFGIFYMITLLVFIIEIQTGALEIAFSDIKACMLK